MPEEVGSEDYKFANAEVLIGILEVEQVIPLTIIRLGGTDIHTPIDLERVGVEDGGVEEARNLLGEMRLTRGCRPHYCEQTRGRHKELL